MGPFAAGTVILLPFPFSDLSRTKLRPALLLGAAGRGDWIASQITSNPYGDPLAIELDQSGFQHGGLDRTSYVRPGKLFTANESLFVAERGTVAATILFAVRDTIIALISGSDRPQLARPLSFAARDAK